MEIKVPAVGESITEALVARWLRHDGERVAKNEALCEIETEKITFQIDAEADGVLSIKVAEGTNVRIGAVIAEINDQAPRRESLPERQQEMKAEPGGGMPPLSPAVRKIIQEKGISAEELKGTGKGERITVEDLMKAEPGKEKEETSNLEPRTSNLEKEGRETRTPMTPIRRKIAEHLLTARLQTAMLTTFNEADMGKVIDIRRRHKEEFRTKHGVSLGFMPFFIKACVEALAEFPMLNARIDGNEIVRRHFYDIGIAISGEKGLVVPVLRDADRLHFAEMEKRIDDFVERIRSNKLTLADLEGGTFTISNGGVYGSLLSTPILNPPQSGVLGIHAIQDRPVAREGKVVIRPMMYIALSYDHRIVDGREAVQFLKRVKELVEEPGEMVLE